MLIPKDIIVRTAADSEQRQAFQAVTLETLPRSLWKARLAELVAINNGSEPNTILTHMESSQARDFLKRVSSTFNDGDGTLAIRNANRFAPGVAESLSALRRDGVKNHLVTGMSFSQVNQLLLDVQPGFEMGVIYEKGGLTLSPGTNGSFKKEYLLATREIVQAITRLKQDFYRDFATRVNSKYNVLIVPAGDGSHETILSFDILEPGSPTDLEVLKGYGHRSEIKVKDVNLMRTIYDEAVEFIRLHGEPVLQGGHLVDLGNSNFEFTANKVGKKAAILQTGELSTGSTLLLGDSRNDAEMFALSEEHGNVSGCLIWNPDSPDELFNMVDFASPGEASAGTMFKLMIQFRSQ